MIKKSICLLFIVGIMLMGSTLNVTASVKDLPTSKKSEHWKVQVDNIHDKNPNGVYNNYRLTVKNLGKHIDVLRVVGFKNKETEPNVVVSNLEKGLGKGYSIKSDFPLTYETNKLVIVISWTEEENGKEHREEFEFNNLN